MAGRVEVDVLTVSGLWLALYFEREAVLMGQLHASLCDRCAMREVTQVGEQVSSHTL